MTKIVKGTLSVYETITGAFVLYGEDAESGLRVPLGTMDDRVSADELRKYERRDRRAGKYDPNEDFLLPGDFDFEIVSQVS